MTRVVDGGAMGRAIAQAELKDEGQGRICTPSPLRRIEPESVE